MPQLFYFLPNDVIWIEGTLLKYGEGCLKEKEQPVRYWFDLVKPFLLFVLVGSWRKLLLLFWVFEVYVVFVYVCVCVLQLWKYCLLSPSLVFDVVVGGSVHIFRIKWRSLLNEWKKMIVGHNICRFWHWVTLESGTRNSARVILKALRMWGDIGMKGRRRVGLAERALFSNRWWDDELVSQLEERKRKIVVCFDNFTWRRWTLFGSFDYEWNTVWGEEEKMCYFCGSSFFVLFHTNWENIQWWKKGITTNGKKQICSCSFSVFFLQLFLQPFCGTNEK